ncbi:MAG: hypothetical protein JOZ73_06670 [Solirubrobacterales bacterium]|nr:hypothetical protein [Solirubrobacterales bacterium]
MVSSVAEAVRVRELSLETVPRSLARRPAATAVGVCLAIAVLSVLVLSWIPSSDPYAWIDWGQEIASRVTGSHIALGLAGGPSWKPFPAIFTTVFGLFGGAAPKLWLIVPRTAGLLALVAAFRLGRRFGGIAAGIFAALALCLVQDWLFYVSRGASEPIVAALTLWAIDRHLSGFPKVAYFLVFLATLNRPEFSAFLIAYGVYLWMRIPETRVFAVVLVLLVPVAWLLPPLVITGNALQAVNAAQAGKGSPGSAFAELRSAPALVTVPVLVLAVVGFAFALIRRESVLQWLGIGAIVWALMVAVMTQISYGLPRYLLPAAVIACVFAGIAVVRVAELAGSRFGSWAAVVIGFLLVAATLPWSVPRVKALTSQAHDANRAALLQHRLFTAVDLAGGAPRVLPCRSSVVAINHTVASSLAWKLQVPLRRVKPLMRGTGYVFRAPHFSVVGQPPAIVHESERTVRHVTSVAPWTVLEVTGRRASTTPHCARGDRA